jgi:2-C-methyl-D-erythritol 4-phosphate cytidylyltransferase
MGEGQTRASSGETTPQYFKRSLFRKCGKDMQDEGIDDDDDMRKIERW